MESYKKSEIWYSVETYQRRYFYEARHSLDFDLDVGIKWCLVSGRFECFGDSLGCGLDDKRKYV